MFRTDKSDKRPQAILSAFRIKKERPGQGRSL